MTSMDKTRTRYGVRVRKGNVYIVMANDSHNHVQYVIKVFSNHPNAVAFVEDEKRNPDNLPFTIEKWAIT